MAAQGHPILIELKNGESFNGTLVNIDVWMNLNLKDAVCTSRDGTRFWKVPSIYIRGNHIKFLRVENSVVNEVDETEVMFKNRPASQEQSKEGAERSGRGRRGRGRGDGRGRGRGRGRGGGRGGRDNRENTSDYRSRNSKV